MTHPPESDRVEITRVLNDYARGVDDGDWGRVLACYHGDAVDDHGVYRGGPDGLVRHFAEQLVAFAGTLHLLGAPDLDAVGPDEVTARTACLALHWREPGSSERHLVMVADYDDRLTRRDGAWRIAERTVRIRHAEELAVAPEIWPLAHLFASADRGDSR